MSDFEKRKLAAIDAVAKLFSATREPGADPSGFSLMVAGKRVAVEFATLEGHGTGRGTETKPRLRFDKVATRLIERIRGSLSESVPTGTTVLLTVTAPILLPSKTATAVDDRIRRLFARPAPGRDVQDEVEGNRVRIRLLETRFERAPKFIAFVHNPDSDPVLLFNLTREWLEFIGNEAARPLPQVKSDRWLVAISSRSSSCLEAYRYCHAQTGASLHYAKILVAFSDGQLGTLTE